MLQRADFSTRWKDIANTSKRCQTYWVDSSKRQNDAKNLTLLNNVKISSNDKFSTSFLYFSDM